MIRPLLYGLLLLAIAGCASTDTEELLSSSEEPVGSLPVTHRLPLGWVSEASTSSMRLAQYRIARDSEQVCVVYWFGAGSGGSREANFDRWKQQFTEGATITSEDIEVADRVSASLLEVRGNYVAEVTPGSAERYDESDWAMLAAYLEVPEGPLFLRLVGPAAEIVPQREAFLAWVRSFRAVD